jgi:transcriptional regulator with XRE-family HTH domain
MNMSAVGAYLQARRQAVRLTQEEVARRIGVTSRTISEWETGGSGPSFDLMARLLDVIKGRIDVVQRLLLDDAITPAEARAEATLTEEERATISAIAITDEKRAALLRRIAELTENPELCARIEDYLRGLEEGVGLSRS